MDELKLIMDKGPRAGENLDFTSRSVIRIGRVVRGNTIAIKDSGISSKHLSIQFDSGAGHWTILDLDSSNGTILNGVQLVPKQPTAIKDGDIIKIGEFTSFFVRIELGEMNQIRRNPRRRGNGGEPENVAVVGSGLSQCGGGSELGLGLGLGSGGDDNVVEVAPVKRNLRPRRGAGSKNDAEEVDTKCVVENVRRTRSLKKKGQCNEFNPTLPAVPESLADGTDHRKLDSFFEGEGKKVRGRKNLPDVSLENVRSGGSDEVSGQEGCSKSMKMAAIDGSLPSESNKAVGGADVREELRVPNDVNTGGKDRDSWKKSVDLEKMTLGEYFDYLEWYLPKQIYEESEAMILNMEQDAAKLHKFRLQHENARDKGKKPMD